ncbi:LURP-one-related/scramblase family protein [Vaginisenegalia massiliensis]|uniref:LURP-one-related/scramblase family protein n=1 Tax=Vaginisenegalia massiliensis TaxID=2058294 RepID=UPI0013DDADD0|nr:LURP-one-related family protein [Vaginisenegalia massiliensis]
MKLYMKQKVFSLKQDFDIYDEHQVPYFKVEGKLISLGRQLTLKDAKTGQELAFIKQRLATLMPKMELYRDGQLIATIKKKFTLLKHRYEIEQIGWRIEGDFFGHNYSIIDQEGDTVAVISKKYFAWSDTFEFDVNEEEGELITVIGVILAIDAAMDAAER